MKFIATTSDKVKSIEVVNGQMIFSRDERTIYLDSEDKRTEFRSIITLIDEAQRIGISPINNAYYFVEETCILYYYNNSWKTITAPPEEKTVFTGGELPQSGKESTLYVTKTGIYQWDKDTDEYVCMGGQDLLSWNPID